MDWKPTEGQNRADMVVRDFARDAEVAVGLVLPEILRWRLFDAVAKTIDQALAEVPANAREALDRAMMDNFPGAAKVAITEGPGGWRIPVAAVNNGNGHADPDDYSDLAILNPEGSPVSDRVQRAVEALAALPDPEPETAPKKRRGRPPGSKGAKAKKKAKAAKVAVVEAAPVPETVAPPVTEQSEAPQ